MSYDLGHSRGYINNISSGKNAALYDGVFGDLRVFRHYADRVFNAGALNPRVNRELWTHWSS